MFTGQSKTVVDGIVRFALIGIFKYLYPFIPIMETKIYVSDDVGARWKELAMKRFGYGRGSISRAAEEALALWIGAEERIERILGEFVSAAKNDARVSALLLFGSYARKERYNDIDVAVVVGDRVGSRERLAVVSEFEKRVPEGVRVDISVFNSLGVDVKSSILSEGIVLYSKDRSVVYDLSSEVIKQNSDFGVGLRSVLGV